MDLWDVEKCIIYWARHGSLRGWEVHYILSASQIFERLRSVLYIERVMDLWDVEKCIIYWARHWFALRGSLYWEGHGSLRGWEVHYILSASWIFERLRSVLHIERVMDLWDVEKCIIYWARHGSMRSALYIERVMDLREVEKCIIYWVLHGYLRDREVHYILSASWIFERSRSALYIERVMDLWEVENCIIYWAHHGSSRGWELHYILSASWIFERSRIALYIERFRIALYIECVMDLWEVENCFIYWEVQNCFIYWVRHGSLRGWELHYILSASWIFEKCRVLKMLRMRIWVVPRKCSNSEDSQPSMIQQ